MAKRQSKTSLFYSCAHIPQQNKLAVEVFCLVAERLKPDLIVNLGDLVGCDQFSLWAPTFGTPKTNYEDDLDTANKLIDRQQATCKKFVYVEGNHENRLDRWAARTAEGRGSYSMLAPRIQLSKGRKNFKYIRYGSIDNKYPHYAVNSRIVAVHGWSYARHATKNHLQMSQGKSIIHGHTHRVDMAIVQSIWKTGTNIRAISAGCLCKQVPI